MKLKKVVNINGEIYCKTGLCISGSNDDLNIGGADSEVIKNPLTGEPYIPGSSIKGKMRSLLERKYGMKNSKGMDEKEKPCGCGKKSCNICKIFGAHMNTRAESAPTRIIVRDALLSEDTRKEIRNRELTQGNFLEIKAENIIKRDNGTAVSPRFIERVPASAKFDFEIILQIFEDDNEKDMVAFVKEGMAAIENSYLGGSGSRGYGQIKFNIKE